MLIALLLSLLPPAPPAAACQDPVAQSEPALRWDGDTEDAYRRALHLWQVRGKPGEAADILIKLADSAEVTQVAGQASWVLVLGAQALAEAGRTSEASALIPGIERGAQGTLLDGVVRQKLDELRKALGEEKGLDQILHRHICQLLSASRETGDYSRIVQYGRQVIPYLLDISLDPGQGIGGQALAALFQTITIEDLPLVMRALRSQTPEALQVMLATKWPLPMTPSSIAPAGSLLISFSYDSDERIAKEAARRLSGWLWHPTQARVVKERALEIVQKGPASIAEALLTNLPKGAYRGDWQEILMAAASAPWPRVKEQARWALAMMPDGVERAGEWLVDGTKESKIRYYFALGVDSRDFNDSEAIRDLLLVLYSDIYGAPSSGEASMARTENWESVSANLRLHLSDQDADVRLVAALAAWLHRKEVPDAMAEALDRHRAEPWFDDLMKHWASKSRDYELSGELNRLGEELWELLQSDHRSRAHAATVLILEHSRGLRFYHVEAINALRPDLVSWQNVMQPWVEKDGESLAALCSYANVPESSRRQAAQHLCNRHPAEFMELLRQAATWTINDRLMLTGNINRLFSRWIAGRRDSLPFSSEDLRDCLELLEATPNPNVDSAFEFQELAALFGGDDPNAFEGFSQYANTAARARRLLEELPSISTERSNSTLLILQWLEKGWPSSTWLHESRTLLDSWINREKPEALAIARKIARYPEPVYKFLLMTLFSDRVIALAMESETEAWLQDPVIAASALSYRATLYRTATWPEEALAVLELPGLRQDDRARVVMLMAQLPEPVFIPTFLQWLRTGENAEQARQGLQRLREMEEQFAFWESWQATGVGGSPTAALLRQIQSKNKEVRLSAIRALGAVKAPEALPLLISLLEDPDPEVVAAARAGLAWLQPDAAPK